MEGPDRYDEYLLRLQQKNRLLKQLKAKDDEQIELERKEQGFSLYVNGANENLKALQNMRYSPRKPTAVKPKTAGEGPRRHLIGQLTQFKTDIEDRAKTAPGKVQRRNWHKASVDIKTNEGSKVKLKSKSNTADYSEDFEVDDSVVASHCWQDKHGHSDESETEEDLEHIHKNMTMILEAGSDKDSSDDDSNSDSEVDAERYNNNSSDEGEAPKHLLLSLEDVKNLRRSLEANADIRQSIGRQGNGRDSDSSSEDEIEEDLDEEDEEIERQSKEDIVPGDMIVLDFGLENKGSHQNKHHLVAKRKPDTEDVSLISSPSVTPFNQSVDTVVCLSATPTPRSSRPLSSQKKVERLWTQEDDLSEIQRAIQAENSALSSRIEGSKEGQPSEVDEEHPTDEGGNICEDDPAGDADPPDLISSQNLDEYKMDMVVDKVKQMDSRSQKKLLRQLEKLEESTSPQRSPKKAASATAVQPAHAEEMTFFSTPKLAPRAMSAVTPRSSRAMTTDVTLEILTNWGHPSRVGLTEVEFYDDLGDRIPLTPTDVWVQGAKSMQGMLGNLVNGRTKTTREKNMWSCLLAPDQPVVLHFKVRQEPEGEEEPAKLDLIRMWNYNKSLRDLNMGVKDARLLLGKDVIWEGVIEKGCGNQVFDYSLSVDVPKHTCDGQTRPRDFTSSKNTGLDGYEGDKGKPIAGQQRVPEEDPQSENHDWLAKGGQGSGSDKLTMADVPDRLQITDTNFPSNDAVIIGDGGQTNRSHHVVNEEHHGKICSESVDHSNSESPMQDMVRSKTKILKRSALQKKSSVEEIISVPNERQQTVIPVESGNLPAESKELPTRQGANSFDYVESLVSSDHVLLTQLKQTKETIDKIMDKPKEEECIIPRMSAKLPEKRKDASRLSYGESMVSSDLGHLEESTDDDKPKYERSKTRLLKRSSENLALPTVDDSIQIFASPRGALETSKGNGSSAGGKPFPRRRAEKLTRSEDEIKPKSEAEDFNQEEMSMLQQLQNLGVAKKETQKPPWLINDKVKEPEDDEPLFGMETFPPKTSTGSIREGTPVGDDLEDVRWRQDAQRSQEGHDGPPKAQDVPYSSTEPGRRAQWRNQRQLSLEESWSSLTMFNKSQKGRLTANMNTEMAGDSLDDYLNQRHLFGAQDESNDDSSDEFEIPVLPQGQQLKILIKTTWGDNHYVGLNGIEVFLSNGELAPITEISADPPDINVLEEYDADPRVVSNLIDGINRTRDDIHMWLAPYIHGHNSLQLKFVHPVKVAMIRIWNYNKSRIHSFRGAKDIEIFMGGQCIFKGEIDRASGAREGDMEAFGDTILFTEDEDILELISKHDEAYIAQTEDWFSSSMEEDLIPERPKTADEDEERPFTTARKFRKKRNEERGVPKSRSDSVVIEGDTSPILEERYVPSAMEMPVTDNNMVCSGRYLKLVFTATWGDYYYLGLTGLEVMDPEGESISFSMDQMEADPRDLNVLPEYGSDDRTLDKIIDGENITTSDEHMWMIPFSVGEDHVLTIDFKGKVQISGLRIWNYNKNPEDTYRGAKTIHVFLDGRQLSPKSGYLIRKGPGNCFFDFAQEITFGGPKRNEPPINQALPKTIQESLRSSIVASEEPSQEYISMHMPCGFVFQFQLLCTWGDQYYVGLNGIEFYDETGKKIVLTETNVAAYPPSINVLEGVDDDLRTPDKLIDGVNNSKDGRHSWLAPILPGMINRVYVIFDDPVTVSMIKLWNYSKSPCRGVKEFGLYLDDLLIYNGILGQVSTGARGILPTIDLPAQYHTILFTDDVELLRQEKHTIIHNRSQDQDVQMTNDREIVEKHSSQKSAASKTVDQALRPKTGIVHGMRSGPIRR